MMKWNAKAKGRNSETPHDATATVMMTTASIASTAHADLCMWAQSSFCTLHHFHAFGRNISDRSNTNYYLGICPQKLPVPVMDLGHASLHTPSTSRVSIGSSVFAGRGPPRRSLAHGGNQQRQAVHNVQ